MNRSASQTGLWTPRQRSVILVTIAILLGALAVRYHLNPVTIPDPQPEGMLTSQLVDRIDPNTADAASLAALPVIGPAIAQRILEEREAYKTAHPGQTAYRQLEDLRRVKGIGQATLVAIEPYLLFQANTPDAPASEAK